MSLRVAGTGCSVGRGVRAFSSTFPFSKPPPPPKPDPSPHLFVNGLNKHTTSRGLREAFAKFGEVLHAKVVTDRVSGSSLKHGFVRYTTTKEAEAAIKAMDAQPLDGWAIFIEYARPKPPPPPLQKNITIPYRRRQ